MCVLDIIHNVDPAGQTDDLKKQKKQKKQKKNNQRANQILSQAYRTDGISWILWCLQTGEFSSNHNHSRCSISIQKGCYFTARIIYLSGNAWPHISFDLPSSFVPLVSNSSPSYRHLPTSLSVLIPVQISDPIYRYSELHSAIYFGQLKEMHLTEFWSRV